MPWESVGVPFVIQANVIKIQLHDSRLGKSGDEEVRPEGDGGGNCWLSVHSSMFAKENDFSWCRHYELERHLKNGSVF